MRDLTKMINKKRIVAALAQLNAIQDEHKEWLAARKTIGADIDPDNVQVHCSYAHVLDPYSICTSFPARLYQIGREYFAGSSNGGIWVSFDDLPRVTVSKLWQRMRDGDFDGPSDWGRMNPAWAKQADECGISHNKMFWQPTAGPLASVPLAGRVAARTTTQAHGPFFIKDADLGSFNLIIDEGHRRYRLAGWIDVGTANQSPGLTQRPEKIGIFCKPVRLCAERDQRLSYHFANQLVRDRFGETGEHLGPHRRRRAGPLRCGVPA